MMTDNTSAMNIPLIIANANSCFRIIASKPRELPNDKDPQSPMNISAGYELNHRKPNPAPTRDAANIATSPEPSMYGMSKYSEILTLPCTYPKITNADAMSMHGRIARPSKPSVKFTAFDDPTRMNIDQGINNTPR